MNGTEMFADSNSSCNVCVDALSDESGFLQDPAYYSYRYRIVGTFFQGIVLIVGVLGNLLVVLVVKRTQNMHTPTNCYLVSLAVADCVVLLSSVPNEILSYYLVGNQWVWGEAGCASFVFGQNLGINASSLSLVAFTVERFIAICHPVTAQRMCTVSRAKRITAGVWAFSLLYCSPWFGLTTTRPLYYKGYRDIVQCDFKLPRSQYLVYFFIDLLVFFVVPVVLSCVLYSLIARVLFSRKIVNTQAKQNGVLHHETSNTARWKSGYSVIEGDGFSKSVRDRCDGDRALVDRYVTYRNDGNRCVTRPVLRRQLRKAHRREINRGVNRRESIEEQP